MSQSSYTLRNIKRRLRAASTSCERDAMRVFISEAERQAADERLADTSAPNGNSSLRNSRFVSRNVRVCISRDEWRLADERLRSNLLDQQFLQVGHPVRPAEGAAAPAPAPLPRQQPVPPRRRHAEIPHKVTYKTAQLTNDVERVGTFYCGTEELPHRMSRTCEYCLAEYFPKETKRSDGRYSLCCRFGRVNVPLVGECPPVLRSLLTQDGHENVLFRNHIRAANSLFAMASFKTSMPVEGLRGQGHWSFNICGQIYHFAQNIPRFDGRNFVPEGQDGNSISYNQYYFLDAEDAVQQRTSVLGRHVGLETIGALENMLRLYNDLVRLYMTAAEVIRHRQSEARRNNADYLVEPTEITLAFPNPWQDGVGEAPTGRHEVAVIFPGEDPPRSVDLVVYDRSRNGRTAELKNLNPLADPMVYPLLFPRGEEGFRIRTLLVKRPRTIAERGGRKEPIIIEDSGRGDANAEDGAGGDDLGEVAEGGEVAGRQGGRPSRKYVSMREFYRYRIMSRRPPTDNYLLGGRVPVEQLFLPPEFSVIHNGGKLFQQYLVDAWVRVEATYLWYIKQHHQTLRKTNMGALRAYLQERARDEQARVGKVVILPSCFLTGRLHMNRRYLDAMTTVARHGCPTFFITFTCNPGWREIVENLEHKQKFEHRPDLVCRVFHVKLLELIDDLYNKQIFGVPLNYMYVVEFQKRGLPHAHILLTLRPEDRPVNEADVDSAIQASFPDQHQQPHLFGMVARHMVHGPCGAYNLNSPCMRDGTCQKHYPKSFLQNTDTTGDDQRLNQPEYRRPDDGRGINRNGVFLNNQWVVPYNRYLLAKFDCHLNVECCGSLKSIKYLHKYVHKGADYCRVQHVHVPAVDGIAGERRVLDWDEVQHYQEHRYVSSMEATWRLLEFPLSDRSHAVVALPVHLPGEHEVIFDENNGPEQILNDLANRHTKLESWFTLNNESEDARRFRYQEIPENYTWENRHCVWQIRRQSSRTLGCLIEIRPDQGDLFYLRMLLGHKRGALSFEDLRTVNGVRHDSFLDACRAMNLLANDDEYNRCLAEADRTRSPFRCRVLFALIVCEMRNNGIDTERIGALWRRYQGDFAQDFIDAGDSAEVAKLKVLFHIKTIVRRSSIGGDNVSLRDLGLPEVDLNDPMFFAVPVNIDDLRVNARDVDAEAAPVDCPVAVNTPGDGLNLGQRAVYDDILTAVRRYVEGGPLATGNLFFVDGPGGCGKTYLYNRIIDEVNDRLNKSCIAVAWTGIAATLLRGGKTVHSAFRLPLSLEETTVAGFPLDSERSQAVRDAVAIFWDEAPMTPRKAVQAVDRYLQDVMNAPGRPFGGKVVLFGGDFRQLLPVIPRAPRTQLIAASLKSWSSWRRVAIRPLTENLRVRHATTGRGDNNAAYARFLLDVGNGTAPILRMRNRPHIANCIELPIDICVAAEDNLIDFVYGPVPISVDFLSETAAGLAILCPTNNAVDKVNAIVLERLAGDSRTYYSVDTYEGDQQPDSLHVPLDLLHSVNISGLGPHELTLKVGAVVVLVRNVDLEQGLCNGTRLQILALGDHVLELKILSGGLDRHRGRIVYLPRMHLVVSPTSGTHLPGPMKRLQFPLRLAFAMTVNKSQGQTFQRVGVHLNTPCFTHGQLYVALSRVGSPNSIRVFIRNCTNQGSFTFGAHRKFTPNIVFPEVIGTINNLERSLGSHRSEGVAAAISIPPDIPSALSGRQQATPDADLPDLTQFYVDDWSPHFIEQVDKSIAASRNAVEVIDGESVTWIRPDIEYPLQSPGGNFEIVDTGVGKGKRPLPVGHPKPPQVAISCSPDSDFEDSPRIPMICIDPELPHPQMLPTVATGVKPGVSGINEKNQRQNINHWQIATGRSDSDSD